MYFEKVSFLFSHKIDFPLSSITITFLLFLVQNKEQNYDLSLSLATSLPQQNKKYVNLKRTLPEVHRPVRPSVLLRLNQPHPERRRNYRSISFSLTHSRQSSLTSATDLSSRITSWSSFLLVGFTARPDWAFRPTIPAPSPDCPGRRCSGCRSHKRAPSAVGSEFSSEWTKALVFC